MFCFRVRIRVGDRLVSPIFVARSADDCAARVRHLYGGDIEAIVLLHAHVMHRARKLR